MKNYFVELKRIILEGPLDVVKFLIGIILLVYLVVGNLNMQRLLDENKELKSGADTALKTEIAQGSNLRALSMALEAASTAYMKEGENDAEYIKWLEGHLDNGALIEAEGKRNAWSLFRYGVREEFQKKLNDAKAVLK